MNQEASKAMNNVKSGARTTKGRSRAEEQERREAFGFHPDILAAGTNVRLVPPADADDQGEQRR